ncbi:MAG: T9SS type A sorting domain-containing protein, partial [Bacteroidota bacterium]
GRTTCNDIPAGPASAPLPLVGTPGGTSTTGPSGNSFALSTLPANWIRLGVCSVLSAEDIHLEAIHGLAQDGVFLDWNANAQGTFARYQVERSQDGIHFEPLADLAKTTEFTDRSPFFGLSFYRVVGIDVDGQGHFSNTVEVLHHSSGAAQVNAWPNPFRDRLEVGFELGEAGGVTLELVSLTGQTVYAEQFVGEAGWNAKVLEVGDLARGMYWVRVREVLSGRVIGLEKVSK